jgi:uncharacterized membrane protein YqiK
VPDACRRQPEVLMFDLAALAIVVACFLFIFVLLWALERV